VRSLCSCRCAATSTTSRRWPRRGRGSAGRRLRRQPAQSDRHGRPAGRRARLHRDLPPTAWSSSTRRISVRGAGPPRDGARPPPSPPGLVVTRTFSKAYGLAGLRSATGASAALLEPVERIRPPFNVSTPALAGPPPPWTTRPRGVTVRETAVAKAVLVEACVRSASATSLAGELRARRGPRRLAGGPRGRRNHGSPGANLGMPGWARVSLGRPTRMRRVVGVMAAALGSGRGRPARHNSRGSPARAPRARGADPATPRAGAPGRAQGNP